MHKRYFPSKIGSGLYTTTHMISTYLRELYWTRSSGVLSFLLLFFSLVFFLLHLAPPDSANCVWV